MKPKKTGKATNVNKKQAKRPSTARMYTVFKDRKGRLSPCRQPLSTTPKATFHNIRKLSPCTRQHTFGIKDISSKHYVCTQNQTLFPPNYFQIENNAATMRIVKSHRKQKHGKRRQYATASMPGNRVYCHRQATIPLDNRTRSCPPRRLPTSW